MSFIVKLGLVGIAAGVGGFATLSQSPELSHRLGIAVPSLSGLTAVVGFGASAATGAAGPIDRTFSVRRVHIDGMVARVELVTLPQPGPVRLQATGKPDTMKELQVRAVGDELFLRLDTDEDEAWFPWNLFNLWGKDRKVQDLSLRISAPVGTPYEIEDMIGVVNAGDIDAPLRLGAHAVQARFGRVQNARISVVGAGHIVLGAVKETLDAEMYGSGRIEAASASAAKIEIGGGGDVVIGPIANGLNTEVNGAGDVQVAQVNGPVDIEINGAGDILINGGRANPFRVEINGAGDVLFKGDAVNPDIEINGAGNVTVRSYTGTLRQDISGAGKFDVMIPHPSAQPPGPPAPPAPPPPPRP
jgi:hypothetical protein